MRVVQIKLNQVVRFGGVGLVLLFLFFMIMRATHPKERPSSFVQRLNDVLPPKPRGPFMQENFIHPPMNVEDSKNNDNIPFAEKTFGEASVFKKGVIGNYEPPEIVRQGPGEGGKAVVTSLEEKEEADKQTREYGFNMVASDKMAWNRTLPDTRMEECKYWHYPEELPTASVIVVFFNEGWSTLLRTVHSVIHTTPPKLLKEVVLIDDGSDYDFLGEKLENYIKQFNGLVKLFRNPERLGLITARTKGAEHSTGDVIVFLDAHCECNKNWLPPLLARIKYDRTILAVPVVDGINWDTMAYYSTYDRNLHRGIFEWGFLYKEGLVPQKVLKARDHPSEPYASPTHAGGLLAMDRAFFFEMGAYDPGLKIWGGENYELAFKVWMCGGSSEWVPCSHVGHIYRGPRVGGAPKKRQVQPKVPHSYANYLRVVEVWMEDEFKEYFYTREPWLRGAPFGDVSKQLKMKEDKKCKSFRWFMDNVAYDVYDKFPALPPNVAWGEVRHRGTDRKCWDTIGQQVHGGPIGVFFCHSQGGNQIRLKRSNKCWSSFGFMKPAALRDCNIRAWYFQLFRINTKGQLGLGERCIMEENEDTLHIHVCAIQPDGPWEFDKATGAIRHTKHNKCVGTTIDDKLHLQTCDETNHNQQWEINEIYPWKN